jgi:hypothetical protein
MAAPLGDRDATLAVAFLQTMETTLRLMHQHKSVLRQGPRA